MQRDPALPNRRAFSLIELLVVILIIAIIVAILLPALGHVRRKAKQTATLNLMNNLSQAISSFNNSERGLPGHFSAREMGAPENGTTGNAGFTSMQNILLDLSGGIVAANTGFQIGPSTTAANQVWFMDEQVGVQSSTNKSYFNPPPKYYKYQDGREGGTKACSGVPYNASKVRDIVDADGMPILAWTQDPMAVGPIKVMPDFTTTAPLAAGPGRFYLNSNAGFLNCPTVGPKRVDQQNDSFIGLPVTNSSTNLAAVLGAPGSPIDMTGGAASILPSAGRGTYVLQSAGANGVFVGKNEKGASRAAATANTLYYGLSFKTDLAGTSITDNDGKPTTSDIMNDFDDIIVSGT